MSPQVGSFVDNMSAISRKNYTVGELQSSQNVWMDEVRLVNLTDEYPQAASGVCALPVQTLPNETSTAPLSASALCVHQHIEDTQDAPNDDDDDFGEFVSASTDPLKQPFHLAVNDGNESQSLLNNKPDSNTQDDIFVGFGLVLPTFARLDLQTRYVRRAGTSARRAWQSLQGQQFSQTPAKDTYSTASASHTSATVEDSVESVQVAAKYTEALMHSQAELSASSKESLLGIVRPVRFVRPSTRGIRRTLGREIEDELEAERAAWNDKKI